MISDLKLDDGSGSFLPDEKQYTNFYPYGMPHPNRSWEVQGDNYRYGFNGVEKEQDVYGKGNLSAMDFRMYDSRVGRWWGVDKIVKVHESPYAAMAGNPINFADPSGLDTGNDKSTTPLVENPTTGGDVPVQTEEKTKTQPVIVPFPKTEHTTAGSASATVTVVGKAKVNVEGGNEGGLNQNVNKAASAGEQKTAKSQGKEVQVQASSDNTSTQSAGSGALSDPTTARLNAPIRARAAYQEAMTTRFTAPVQEESWGLEATAGFSLSKEWDIGLKLKAEGTYDYLKAQYTYSRTSGESDFSLKGGDLKGTIKLGDAALRALTFRPQEDYVREVVSRSTFDITLASRNTEIDGVYLGWKKLTVGLTTRTVFDTVFYENILGTQSITIIKTRYNSSLKATGTIYTYGIFKFGAGISAPTTYRFFKLGDN